MIESKRIGKFKVTDDMINHNPDVVKGVMGECIIIGAKHNENNRLMEYIAINDHFQETAGYINPPEYIVEIIRHTSGNFDIRWKAK
mgnify:CR=1 FL=1